MTAADVVEPVLVTVKGHVLEVAAPRVEELAGETGARVIAQQLVEWIVLVPAKGSVVEAVQRSAQTAVKLAVKVAAERKLG